MERRASLRLWRLSPPFSRAVEIRRISVGGFLDLVRHMAPKAAAALLKADKPMDEDGLIRACANADSLAYFADIVAVDQPIGFLRGWLHGKLGGALAYRNTRALLAASRVAEGDGQWTRFLGCLNRGTQPGDKPKKKAEGGGLMADVLTVAALQHLDPMVILAWPLGDFLNLCEAMNLMAKVKGDADPLSDPDAEPMDSVGIPGLWEVH